MPLKQLFLIFFKCINISVGAICYLLPVSKAQRQTRRERDENFCLGKISVVRVAGGGAAWHKLDHEREKKFKRSFRYGAREPRRSFVIV
uniref:Putative secreted protein n=1 Tax=Ixodes ricinus TaxID=34613 RepID=A0A6B0U092_IXORI